MGCNFSEKNRWLSHPQSELPNPLTGSKFPESDPAAPHSSLDTLSQLIAPKAFAVERK
jgi:hypothetical protein